MATDAMPVDVGAKLVRHGVLKPAKWPKFEVIEKAIKAKRGTFQVQGDMASVRVLGKVGVGSAEQANEALTIALIDALDQAMPLLPGLEEQLPLGGSPAVDAAARDFVDSVKRSGTRMEISHAGETVVIDGRSSHVDPETGEITEIRETEFEKTTDRTPEDIAKAFSAKGEEDFRAVYDPALGEYRTEQGDIYAAGAVEDAVGVKR